MAHIEFPDEGRLLIGLSVFDLPVYGREDIGDGVLAEGFFAEHIFLAGLGHDLDAGDACAFLPAVVLLLHHEIELVQRIEFRTVFFLVILKRLEQPDHGDAAFVLDRFHRMRLQGAKIIKRWRIRTRKSTQHFLVVVADGADGIHMEESYFWVGGII